MLVPFKIQSPNCRVDRKTHYVISMEVDYFVFEQLQLLETPYVESTSTLLKHHSSELWKPLSSSTC